MNIRFIKAAYTLSGTIYVHHGFMNPVFIPETNGEDG